MASENPPQMKATLGLTGLTVNAMALIAPGAFLWLTYQMQSSYGAPMAGSDIWFGIVAALMLCFATAISYAELSKLYPGAGSSYFFAEQAFLTKTHAYKFARIAKFIMGWASHLYYWVYPGVMVGVTAILVGYLLGNFFPDTFSSAIASPLLMVVFCVVFALGIGYIAQRGASATTGVNLAVNIVQISALIVFSVIALAYRTSHPQDSVGWTFDPDGAPTQLVYDTFKADDKGNPVKYQVDSKGEPVKGADGNFIPDEKGQYVHDDAGVTAKDADSKWITAKDDKGQPKKLTLDYRDSVLKGKDDKGNETNTRQWFGNPLDVILPHGVGYIFIQASIAILILVGFESVTSMGEEARNAKRDIPRAVLLSLAIQGIVCYLIQYFCANYFLNPGYPMTKAAGSSAPIGDMMVLAGTWLFGSPEAGTWFMRIEAITVFLALIGTTLSCLSTGARVTYAMGRDDEVPSHFGMLHGKNLTPHRAIWTLSAVSAVIGIAAVYFYLCGPAATASLDTALTDSQKASIWYSFGTFSYATAQNIPNSLLVVSLLSNFGTFMLYMLTCITAIVAFREHHTFNTVKHTVVPIFGLLANLACMAFYLIGPIPGVVTGMSWKEPYSALGLAAIWGLYGLFYFVTASKKKGKGVLVEKPAAYSGAGKEAFSSN